MVDDIKPVFPPEFWNAVHARQRDGQRHGQAVFNAAYEYYPEAVRSLTATSLDPFYNDSRVYDFLSEVWERLKNAA
jgi:hypothetical protein